MLIWVLIALGIAIVIARAVWGHRIALVLVAVWVAVAVIGWATGLGVRS